MKHIFSIISIISVICVISATASAQDIRVDESCLKHLAAGVTAGPEGLGLALAAPLGDHLQVRVGYSSFPKTEILFSKFVDMTSPYDIHRRVTVATFYATSGPSALVDYYPSSLSNFYICMGVFLNNGTRSLGAYTTEPLPIDEEDYGCTGFVVGDHVVTTDPSGIARGYVDYSDVKPYIGIGVGRPCNLGKRVSLSVDTGFLLLGRPRLYSFDWTSGSPVEVEVTSADIGGVDEGFFDFTREGLLDIVRKITFMPAVRFNVSVRLF